MILKPRFYGLELSKIHHKPIVGAFLAPKHKGKGTTVSMNMGAMAIMPPPTMGAGQIAVGLCGPKPGWITHVTSPLCGHFNLIGKTLLPLWANLD